MPQMSPMYWLFLYFYLLLVIYLFNVILSYFVLKYKKNMYLNKSDLNNYKWCW